MCLKYLVDILSEVATWCNHDPTPDPIITIQYGALYNEYAVINPLNITNTGWHVPTKTEFETLQTYLGGNVTCAGKLRETGVIYWDLPNLGATNETSFNGRGSGQRHFTTSLYSALKLICHLWSSTENAGSYYEYELHYDSLEMSSALRSPKYGQSVRPMKDSTTLTHGQTGTYTGNDGKVYRTICIGTQEWVADNIAETKYRDGSDIPIVTDNATWAALLTGAMCYYNNDISNM